VFFTCPRCRSNSGRNRMNEDLFMCTSCGFSYDFHALGSYNLANWLKIYNEKKIAFYVRREDRRVRIFNEAMQVDFCSASVSTAFEEFYIYLQDILQIGGIDQSLSQSQQKKQYSIYKKLKTAPNIRDVVYFREVGG